MSQYGQSGELGSNSIWWTGWTGSQGEVELGLEGLLYHAKESEF